MFTNTELIEGICCGRQRYFHNIPLILMNFSTEYLTDTQKKRITIFHIVLHFITNKLENSNDSHGLVPLYF